MKQIKINVGTLDDIEFPNILYKYRDWNNENNKRFITEKEIYMASPNQFVDILDCKIPIRYDLMSDKQAKLFYERLSNYDNSNKNRREKRKFIKKKIKSKEHKNKDFNKKYLDYYFQEYFKRIGILSLTAERCLDEMWVKYADNHAGFCIGYNTRILFEYLGGGAKVEYYKNVPILLPEPIMDYNEIHHKQIYFKEEKWGFEKEYRTEKFWFDGAGLSERQIKIPKEAINCIILGSNMTTENRTAIKKATLDNIGDILILEELDLCNNSGDL